MDAVSSFPYVNDETQLISGLEGNQSGSEKSSVFDDHKGLREDKSINERKIKHEASKHSAVQEITKFDESDLFQEFYCHDLSSKLFKLYTGKNLRECVADVYHLSNFQCFKESLKKPNLFYVINITDNNHQDSLPRSSHSFSVKNTKEGYIVSQSWFGVYNYQQWCDASTKSYYTGSAMDDAVFHGGFLTDLETFLSLDRTIENKNLCSELSLKLFGVEDFILTAPMDKPYLVVASADML